MSQPLVSVVIPTYERAHTLRRAIDCALAQTYEPIEVVVTDNASTDGTADVLESYRHDRRMRIVMHETNIGPVLNWASGIEAARGDLIKINWSDDWMDSHVVEVLATAMRKDPSAGFAICDQTIHVAGHARRSSTPRGDVRLPDVVRSLAAPTYAIPVSPGAALLYRGDVVWGLELGRRELSSACVDRAIGPDLTMLYAAFRRTPRGVSVGQAGVHFEGGTDSITMTEDHARLRSCYVQALDALLRELGADGERATLWQLGALRQAAQALRGRSAPSPMPASSLRASAHVKALPRTAEWLTTYVAERLKTRRR